MNALTPTAQAVLDALREAPAAAAELRQRLNRGRSTIDKALAELARHDLATKTDQDCWILTKPDETQPGSDTQAIEPAPLDNNLGDVADLDQPDETPAPPAGTPATDDETPPTHTDDETVSVAEEVKICRGCQAQMPKICPTCWSKTTSYCGDCRRQHPTRHLGTGEPGILSTGLPKLGRGELVRLVEDVMRTQPLPEHLGITGWTPGRIAVFLPGRSTGAIGNALERLTTTGTAELLGDAPKRYRPIEHVAAPATADGDELQGAPDSRASTDNEDHQQ